MQLIIHRGTNETGGSCLELNDGKTRLIFDVGLPLDDGAKDVKPDIKGLYGDEETDIDAIFITHAHPDHFGLLEFINSKIPIYMNKVTSDLIQKVYPLTSNKYLENLDIHIIDTPIKIGDFTITPHIVDHSAVQSLAYEIQCKNKKILYTGDLRFHGRKGYYSEKLKKIKDVDYLIMEGSNLGRENENQKSENDVCEELKKAFEKKKLSLITFSSQNLDRFISVFKACLGNKKTLVLDPYTCYVLENFKGLSKNIPQYDCNNIQVYFSPNSISEELAKDKTLYKYKSKKISLDEIRKNPSKYVLKDNFYLTSKILKIFKPEEIQYIYSLWKGYLEKSSHTDILKPQLIHIHSSGHAYIEDLQNFVKELSPKTVIPIHTQHPEKYEELFKANVLNLSNGKIIDIAE